MAKLTKVFQATNITCDEGKREIVGIINTTDVDRDGEVVLPQGLNNKQFQGNPVVFVNHQHDDFPVGKCLWMKAATTDDGKPCLIAKTYITDKTQEGIDCFKLFQDGILNCFSIGFIADSKTAGKPTKDELAANPEWKNAKTIIRNWEMLEYSVVGLPANPECVALCVAKGFSPESIKKYEYQEVKKETFPKFVEHLTMDDVFKMFAKHLKTKDTEDGDGDMDECGMCEAEYDCFKCKNCKEHCKCKCEKCEKMGPVCSKCMKCKMDCDC